MGSLIPDWCNDTVLAQVKEAASADLCVDTFLHGSGAVVGSGGLGFSDPEFTGGGGLTRGGDVSCFGWHHQSGSRR